MRCHSNSSIAAYRFGHSMVRAFYNYNKISVVLAGSCPMLPSTSYSVYGRRRKHCRCKEAAQELGDRLDTICRCCASDATDGQPARAARKIDTEIAPSLGNMVKEGNDEANGQIKDLFKHLARRNLRRGYNLQLATGQAVHKYLQQHGALKQSNHRCVDDLSSKPELRDFLKNTQSGIRAHTIMVLSFGRGRGRRRKPSG